MTDLEWLGAMVETMSSGTFEEGVAAKILAVVPELIVEAFALRATRGDRICPERRCPCSVGAGDNPHPCTLCGSMRALDAKLAEVLGE